MARIDGQTVISRFDVNCWGCGDRLFKGEELFQGDDDHNYGVDCCADLTAGEIEANAQEWAEFNGASFAR